MTPRVLILTISITKLHLEKGYNEYLICTLSDEKAHGGGCVGVFESLGKCNRRCPLGYQARPMVVCDHDLKVQNNGLPYKQH